MPRSIWNGRVIDDATLIDFSPTITKRVTALTPEEYAVLGIAPVIEQPRPDTTYGTAVEDPAKPGSWIYTPFPASELAVLLIQRAAAKRYEKEVSGIAVGGLTVATDDRSKIMIIGARMAAVADPSWTTAWATGAQSVTVDAPTIIAISNSVQAHVNACFSAYKTAVEGINSGAIVTFEAVDAEFA